MTNRKGSKRGPNHIEKLKAAPHHKRGKPKLSDAVKGDHWAGQDFRPRAPDTGPVWDFSREKVK